MPGASAQVIHSPATFPPPHFPRQILRRGVYVERDPEGQVVNARDEATDIMWHDGMNLMHREVKRHGGGKKVKMALCQIYWMYMVCTSDVHGLYMG